MARNGAGAYSLPAGNPVVTGTVISSSTMNTTLSDIATALTASIANDGQTTPVANLPMGGFKLTGLGDATVANDAIRYNGALGTPSSGTVTNLTGTASININGTVGATTPAAGSFTTATLAAGAVGTPSLTTTGDTNTGVWFPAADTIAWSTGGIERLRVDANGSITGTVTAGAEAFKISSDTASVNSRHRLNTTSATSSVAYCLSNSNGGVNTQVSLVLGGSGSTSFYVNQSAAADSVSGTQSLSLFTDGTIAQVAVAPLGYGTGSGGTVTQATSRTTGVTLNKPTGAITLFTAAGSATATTFTVTNSLISATDTVVLSVKSATNVYIAFVTAVAAGSFNVTFWTTGGTASDAPVINFALMKGVAA